MEPKIKDILEDIGDANDAEVHAICGLEDYRDARQKVLRLARSGDIPSHPWNGKKVFFKSELRRHMAAVVEAK